MRRDSPRYGNFPKRRKSRESPWNRASPAFGKLWEHAGKCRVDFNEKLIEIRKKQGLSQEELGMELQVSRQTISKWETGVSQTKGY